MPNTAPVTVPITVDNATAQGIQSAVASLKQFEAAGTSAGEKTAEAFHESRGAAELLGESVGIHVNRELRSLLATSSSLGPLLEAAFPVAAAIGFVTVLHEAANKLSEFISDTFIFTDEMKKAQEAQNGWNQEIVKSNQHIQELKDAFDLIGATGANRIAIQIEQQGRDLDDTTEKIKRLTEAIFILQNKPELAQVNNLLPITINGKDLSTIDELSGALGVLRTHLADVLQAQANLNKELRQADAKEADEALKKYIATILDGLHKLDAFNTLQAKVFSAPTRFNANNAAINGNLPEQQISPPSTGKLSDFGIKSPLFPLFATPEELETAKKYGFVLTGIAEQTKQLSSAQKELDQALTHGFDNAFQDIALGTRSVGQAFESLASSVAAAVLQMVAKLLILPPILSAINSALNAIGLGSSFGAKGTVTIPGAKLSDVPLFGARASGGPVMPNGTYLVGENGPELLRMGSSSGFVNPSTGGGNITVNVINRSSQQVGARASQPRVTPSGIVTDVILEDLKTNGPIRQALKAA